MSQKKKAYVEPVYSAAAGPVRSAAPEGAAVHELRHTGKAKPEGTQTAAAGRVDGREPGRDPAGRDYDVLPGILGKQLRTAYGELLNVPVPDRFADLIKQLERREEGKPNPAEPRDKEEGK